MPDVDKYKDIFLQCRDEYWCLECYTSFTVESDSNKWPLFQTVIDAIDEHVRIMHKDR